MAGIGFEALNVALVLSAYSAIVYLLAIKRNSDRLLKSAQRAVYAWSALITLAAISLFYSLFTRDFQVEYVAQYSNRALSWFYTAAAFWGGQAGSLLFWAWLLAIFSFIVLEQNKKRDPERLPYVMIVMSVATLFFLYLLVFKSNPFQKLPFTPMDGKGLNPLLQNPQMVFHPPTLYLGFVSATVPFAMAFAALLTRNLDMMWLRSIRNWSLFAWLFLTIGNVLGMQWAYVELGWGGYWAWDPVENSSLLPWLTLTAFVHSLMVQEFRGMLKTWNIVLIMLTFALTIFGTFVTRSGLISSVHAFGVSDLGPLFLGYLAIIVISTIVLILNRLPILKSKDAMDSWSSRESSFLLNNMLFIALTVGVFIGTVLPSISEAMNGEKQTVSVEFFNRMATPFGLVIFFLIGLGTLLSWRKTQAADLKKRLWLPIAAAVAATVFFVATGIRAVMPLISLWVAVFAFVAIIVSFVEHVVLFSKREGVNPFMAVGKLVMKNKRRYGAYIVHLGVLMMFLGFIGSSAFSVEQTATLDKEETIKAGGYEIRYMGIESWTEGDVDIYSGRFDIYKKGRFVSQLRSEKHQHPNFQPSTEVGIRTTMKEDIYVILAGFEVVSQRATVTVLINPMMFWMWFGGIVMVAGTLLTFVQYKPKSR